MIIHHNTDEVNNDGEEGFYDGSLTLLGELKKHSQDRKLDNFYEIRKMFPLVLVQVWYKGPGNYTHLILIPEIIL